MEQDSNSVEQMQQIEVMLRTIMDSDAKERLSNIKIVNSAMYYKVAKLIFQFYQSGQLEGRIDDNTLKVLLSRVQPKREIKITRK